MRKIVISLIVLATMFGFFLLAIGYSPYEASDQEGTITILVVDASGETIIEDTHAFSEEDTLFSILSSAYEIDYRSMIVPYFEDGRMRQTSSRAILAIGTVETDFERQFLKIYLHEPVYEDDQVIDYRVTVSRVGVDHLPLRDAYKYEFRVERVIGGGS